MKNNFCWLIGHMGTDPVVRGHHTHSGSTVTFTVAENVTRYDAELNEYKTIHTNWFNITTFGSLADRVSAHLKKGDRVAIQGKMRVSKYTTKSGEEKTGFEIIAEEIVPWKNLPSSESLTESVIRAEHLKNSPALNEEDLLF